MRALSAAIASSRSQAAATEAPQFTRCPSPRRAPPQFPEMSDVEFELPGSCSPLPTHIAAGATLSYEPLMLGRTEEMTTLFQSLLNAIFVPEGENGWETFQDAATVYVQNLLAPIVPPVACGALLLLCLLPLWISRCCAHRCCAPGLGHQRRADKITSAGCCCLFAFGMLGAAAGGVLGAVQTTTGFKAGLCELHALADNQTDTLNSLGGALRDVATAATDSLGATASLLTARRSPPPSPPAAVGRPPS